MLNLISDPWLPVRRLHSGRCTIRPAQLTEAIADDPVISIDWPRADFRIATLELLIGLLATACPPSDHDAWLDAWEVPPDPATLDAALAFVAHAFALDGAGPRFLQDREEFHDKSRPIERLLIEAPGEETLDKNTDLLVKGSRFSKLARSTAAIALYTLQSSAPGGGRGNMASARGGGPITTVVLPKRHPSLWHLVWANMPSGIAPVKTDLSLIFPWLVETVSSHGARVVVPDENAHPLQIFWSMPRRIRLDFVHDGIFECDLSGISDTVAVIGWRQRPYGPKYKAWGNRHPLTPRERRKGTGEWVAVRFDAEGIGYHSWVGLVVAQTDVRVPADVVTSWRRDRWRDAGETLGVRLLAAGFAMDRMLVAKARAFVESEMPLPGTPDAAAQQRLDDLATRLVRAADLVAGLLRGGVRAALFRPGATVKLDAELLSNVRESLWKQTEVPFFNALERAARRDAAEGELEAWRDLLRRTALALFDEAAPLSPFSGSAAPRIGRARRKLLSALTGFGHDGAALFEALGLPAAEPKARKRKVS